MDTLESRQVMSAGGPSAEAQAMIESINAARMDPKGMAEVVTSNPDADLTATFKYYNVDVNAVKSAIASSAARPPVAWSDQLAQTATGQSQDQANSGSQSHTGADGSGLDQRLDRVGYTNRSAAGENAYAYSQSVDHAMEAFLIDWGVAGNGHRNNLLQPAASPDQYYKEVGIGIVSTNRSNFGPKVITQDFGTRAGSPAYLLGVAFNDGNHDGRYDMGEGQGNVEVSATNVDTGETKSVETWDAGGGYQIPLPAGNYSVTAKVGDQLVRTDRVSIANQNVKMDYNLSNPWQGGTAPIVPTRSAPITVSAQSVSAPMVVTQAAVTPTVVSTPVTTPTPPVVPAAASVTAAPATSATVTQSDSVNWNLISPATNAVTVASKTAARSGWFGNSWSAWTARRVNG